MKAEELIKAAHVAAETIGENCVRITAEDGWKLKHATVSETVNEQGETEKTETVSYIAELYCRPDAVLPDYEVMSDADRRRAEMAGQTLEEAKETLLAAIAEYDESAAVNSFTVMGQSQWLNKATRVALMNSATVSKAMGETAVTLWLNSTPLTLPTDTAITLLSQVEMYAQECFNVTSRHKAAVSGLQSAEECAAYDFTRGYPARLEFSLAALGLA